MGLIKVLSAKKSSVRFCKNKDSSVLRWLFWVFNYNLRKLKFYFENRNMKNTLFDKLRFRKESVLCYSGYFNKIKACSFRSAGLIHKYYILHLDVPIAFPNHVFASLISFIFLYCRFSIFF